MCIFQCLVFIINTSSASNILAYVKIQSSFVPCLREDGNFLKKYSASRGTHGRG